MNYDERKVVGFAESYKAFQEPKTGFLLQTVSKELPKINVAKLDISINVLPWLYGLISFKYGGGPILMLIL